MNSVYSYMYTFILTSSFYYQLWLATCSWLYTGVFGGRSRLHRNQHIQWNVHCSSRLRYRTFGKHSHN